MAIGYDDLKDANYKALGLYPDYTEQVTPYRYGIPPFNPPYLPIETVAPPEYPFGVDISEGIANQLRIVPREHSKWQQGWFYITNVDVGDTYRATVDGVNFDYICAPGDTEADILEGIRLQFAAAGAPYQATVETWPDSPTTTIDVLRTYTDYAYAGAIKVHYPYNHTWTTTVLPTGGGTGTMNVFWEATTVRWCIHLAGRDVENFDSVNDTTWLQISPTVYTPIPAFNVTRNWVERLDTAGFDYGAIELDSCDGIVRVYWGPSEIP